MVGWLTILFDSRIFMRINAGLGFLFLGFLDNIVPLANCIQTVYTLFLLTADIALLILRKIR